MFRNIIPETLEPHSLCNGMKNLISDHGYKFNLGGLERRFCSSRACFWPVGFRSTLQETSMRGFQASYLFVTNAESTHRRIARSLNDSGKNYEQQTSRKWSTDRSADFHSTCLQLRRDPQSRLARWAGPGSCFRQNAQLGVGSAPIGTNGFSKNRGRKMSSGVGLGDVIEAPLFELSWVIKKSHFILLRTLPRRWPPVEALAKTYQGPTPPKIGRSRPCCLGKVSALSIRRPVAGHFEMLSVFRRIKESVQIRALRLNHPRIVTTNEPRPYR